MKNAIIAAAALAVSGTAIAGPSWTYVDLGYTRQSSIEDPAIGNNVDKSQGYELTGSFGFGNIWHVGATYGSAEAKVNNASDIELDKYYDLRAGVHPAITDSTDFVAEIGYTKWETKNAGGLNVNNKPKAYDITVGVRSMLSEKFELKRVPVGTEWRC